MKEETCKKKGFNSGIFWLTGFQGDATGGIFFRSFDLNQFLRNLELDQGMNVVGLRFKENNMEVIVEGIS